MATGRRICRLAAAYAFGIIRDHPFVDGNKRTGFLAAYVFLKINGFDLVADEVETTAAVMAIASREENEAQFADWPRAVLVRSEMNSGSRGCAASMVPSAA